MEYQHVCHEFAPVFDIHSRVLILGSLPSVKSREQQFYYGHPQNRFWKIIAKVCECETPVTVDEKRAFLLENRIALWDTVAECDIIGSSDSSMKNVIPNDLSVIVDNADIKAIFVNGSTAERIYIKYQQPVIKREAVRLPSTSPANAAWSFDRLLAAWNIIKDHL